MSIYGDGSGGGSEMSEVMAAPGAGVKANPNPLVAKWKSLEPLHQKVAIGGSIALVLLIVLYFAFFSGDGAPPQQNAAMTTQMGGNNLLTNGELLGPLVNAGVPNGPMAGASIAGWTANNAAVEIVQWPAYDGRQNIVKVGDAGGCSEITQTLDTVVGQKYTISFDVWTDDAEFNSGNQPFCSSTDTNGILIARHGTFDGTCATKEAVEAGTGRFCSESSYHWVTVSGTYTATETKTSISLHSDGTHAAYFDQVFMTTAADTCKASTDSIFPDDPTLCQCAHVHESQHGFGNNRAVAQGERPCTFTSGNSGKGMQAGCQQNGYQQNGYQQTCTGPPSPDGLQVTNWMDADACLRTPPRSDPAGHQQNQAMGAIQGRALHIGEICADVDTSSHGFAFTPHYVASLGGTSDHHTTTGASSIYHASPTGFRVYIKREACLSCVGTGVQYQPAFTPALAKERGYHINWVAETAPCDGAGDSTGGAQLSNAQSQDYGYTAWQPYCWVPGQCTGVHVDITFPPGAFQTTPVIVSGLHGHSNHADARGGNAIYSASPTGFKVYIHSTAGTGVQGQQGTGITPAEVQQWGWKVVYIATEDTAHSGTSSGLWVDSGENTVETIVCHGTTSFGKTSTVNYVTSITGSSHHWTSDGAGSVYTPTGDSFRVYMFREGDGIHGPGATGQRTMTGTGSGGGAALTAAGAMSDNWKINWIGMPN